MSSVKTASGDALSIALIKGADDFLLDKLAILLTKRLQNCTVPSTWKNALLIQIHTKRRHQGPKKLSSNKSTVCSIQAFY